MSATIASLKDLKKAAADGKKKAEDYKIRVSVCGGTGCRANNCQMVIDELHTEIQDQGLTDSVKVTVTGCHGFCEQGPLMIVNPGNTLYCRLKPGNAAEIVRETFKQKSVLTKFCYMDPVSRKKISKDSQIPFYKAQDRAVLGLNKLVDPASIDDYIAQDGYQSLAAALEIKPVEIIEKIKKSGLRGRGGGGYPTGDKWEQAAQVKAVPKYVICNADEGDPGAYMDRSVLEGNPHLVIEGMIIGAYAVGASEGIIYVRKEYPLAVLNTRIAVQQAMDRGILGENILGRKFNFKIRIVRGGGAFICGESSALMASVMGKTGEPRAKDIHAVEKGLFDHPTVLNNVETWANVPLIMEHGASWFAKKGTSLSKGTKIFALTGMVKNTGLVEVEMGTTLKKIIFDIGGGAAKGHKIKAVQTGGPSGGCLPVSKFNLPVDFEVLTDAGAMVGSGGMIVMDDTTCMVDVARYFLDFLIDESCGKCSVCRIGLSRMREIIGDITAGKGREEQLDLLRDIAETMSVASLCALGKTAANPVLSTLKYFSEEYLMHIRDHKCPAGVCKALVSFSINNDKCNACGLCIRECPKGAIRGGKSEKYKINPELCSKCGICRDVCNFGAVVVD